METHKVQTIGLQINPSEEIIRLGPLAVYFLITGETSKWQHRGI
jgi:hypothetical protein